VRDKDPREHFFACVSRFLLLASLLPYKSLLTSLPPTIYLGILISGGRT
jgi:hypothetical protein